MKHLVKIGLQVSVAAFIVAGLSGCEVGLYRNASEGINAANNQANQISQAAQGTAQPVVVHPGYYVNSTPIAFDKTPKFLQQHVTIHANGMPLNLLMSHALANSGLVVGYDRSMQPGVLVSLNYSGDLKTALNDIAEQTGYAYTLSGNQIIWSAFETRTFNISFMPGASSYSLGGSLNGASDSDNENSTGMAGDSQFSKMDGNLSIWKDLTNTLNKLKSKSGEVMVSQSSTTVTVRDYPENVAAMARYIKKLNKILSQEVQLRVKVINVSLDKQYDYGINWKLIGEKVGRFQYGITGSAGAATALGGATEDATGALTNFTFGTGKSSAVLQALSEQGDVSVVTQPTVVTLNNQVASIRITQDEGYLKSLTNTITTTNGSSTASGSNSVNSSITPGTVTSGFILYILPKIQGNQVYLQITSTISDLTKLQKVSTSPTDSTDSSSSSSSGSNSSNYMAIQVPTLSSKEFNIRSKVHNGNTLVLAGFKSMKNQTSSASPFGVTPLGGQGAEQTNVQTIVMITPVIVKSR